LLPVLRFLVRSRSAPGHGREGHGAALVRP
jgi:hypothetical protein